MLIAPLPNGDGDYRPIGLLPTAPGLWMRARRHQARKWEEENSKPWLYAGKGMGAAVAGWRQAIEAEHAASILEFVSYGQALLDLVKAFDKVPLLATCAGSGSHGIPTANSQALNRSV